MSTLYLTGSSGGLGRSIREYYLEQGWSVAGFDRNPDDFSHSQYRFFAFDSSDDISVGSAFTQAQNSLGPARALVATIGGIKPWAGVDEMAPADFDFVWRLNVVSAFLSIRHALKMMRPQQTGSIVTIGAETALRPEPKKAAYVAAKSAVIAMTETVALETKEYGVNTNCIIPTVIHTRANEEWGSPEEIVKWTKPNDIAALCFYLCGDSGKAVNGATIRIPNIL